MNINNSQIQNLSIFTIDIVGMSIGYFLMTFLRFRGTFPIDPEKMVFYSLFIVIFVLTFLYLVFNPNHDFFKVFGKS